SSRAASTAAASSSAVRARYRRSAGPPMRNVVNGASGTSRSTLPGPRRRASSSYGCILSVVLEGRAPAPAIRHRRASTQYSRAVRHGGAAASGVPGLPHVLRAPPRCPIIPRDDRGAGGPPPAEIIPSQPDPCNAGAGSRQPPTPFLSSYILLSLTPQEGAPHGIRAGPARTHRAALAHDARPSIPPANAGRDHPVRDVRHLDAAGLPLRRGRDPLHRAAHPEGPAGALGGAFEGDRHAPEGAGALPGAGGGDQSAARPSFTCDAYIRFLMATAYAASYAEAYTVLYAAEKAYHESWKVVKAGLDPSSPWQPFVENWAGEAFAEYVAYLESELDWLAEAAGPAERERMARLFETTVRYEIAFWEMAATGESWPGDAAAAADGAGAAVVAGTM